MRAFFGKLLMRRGRFMACLIAPEQGSKDGFRGLREERWVEERCQCPLESWTSWWHCLQQIEETVLKEPKSDFDTQSMVARYGSP